MTVAELIKELKKQPQDAMVVMSRDSEGNSYSPLADLGQGRYEEETSWSGQLGIVELTEEYIKQGYTEEDVLDGPIVVALWPTN